MKPFAGWTTKSGRFRRDPYMPTNWQVVLSTIGVAALGIGQPILDLLGRTPDFFIARAAPQRDLILLALVLGLAIPLALATLALFSYSIGPRAGKSFHLIVMASMASLVAVNGLRYSPIDDQRWFIAIGSALLLGSLLAWGYYRQRWLRSFLHIIGGAPLIIVVVFLVFSPVSEVAWGLEPTHEGGFSSAQVNAPAPLVILVFDEFPVASIIDPEGRIKGEDFPALADLSNNATWFRNAVGTHEGTRDALPTMVSGVSQVAGERLPHFADHPSSLFTLLANDYDVNAIETLTQLCPEDVCLEGTRDSDDFQERWTSLREDLFIVSGHLFLPGELRDGLPPIDQNWGNFKSPSVTRPDNWSIRERMRALVEDDRRTVVEQFLRQLEHPLQENEFYFIHMPLPHSPWIHMADGRTYNALSGLPGAEGKGWKSNSWLIEQAYQQHLLEVQYVDHIVGSVVQRLKDTGSYDSSILIITADHGIAIRPNTLRRIVRPETVGDIAAVPLFIKVPNQSRRGLDDYRAEITDIVPTIAGLLDVDIPWAVDGIDLFGSARPERMESTIVSPTTSVTFGVDGQEKFRVVEYHSPYFGDRGPFGISPPGYAQLLGQTVATAGTAETGVTMTLDSPELYADVDPDAGHLPILVSGTLDRSVSSGDVLAVTIGSKVVAITKSWEEDSVQRFQALLPADELQPGEIDLGFYMVRDDDGVFTFSVVGGA
jgi:hypothetical protein